MTYLYPLNNYPLFCQYSLSFESENVEAKDYRAFKKFLENHESTSLIKHPIIPTFNTQCLTQDPQSLHLDFAGIPLESEPSHERLYLVPDHIDLLTLGSILRESRHESYLYESAYHYWCHKSFFDSHTINQPIVFLNLDGWELNTLIPLTLEHHLATQRRIPILKPQSPIKTESLIDLKSCHDKIHTVIAQQILNHNFPDLSKHKHTLKQLSDYLKKINITHYAHNQEPIINIIVEISPQPQKIFYKSITLYSQNILEIAIKGMPLLEITKLKKRYPDITFIGISQYSIPTDFHPVSQEIHILMPQPNLFANIWQEKQSQDFPLFGIQLDRIQFEIAGQNNPTDWIELGSRKEIISYEGKSQEIIGEVPGSGRKEFKISRDAKNNKISLPIQINQQDYGKGFEITVHNFDHQHDVWVQIFFTLTPGKLPRLTVKDTQNYYRITSQLVDKDPIQYPHSESNSHIPLQQIYQTRRNDAISQAEKLNIHPMAVSNRVKLLNLAIQEYVSESNIENLSDALIKLSNLFKLSTLSKKKKVPGVQLKKIDPLQYLDPDKVNLDCKNKLNLIRLELQTLKSEKLHQILFSDKSFDNKDKLILLKIYLIFSGKLYFLSDSINIGNFLLNKGQSLLNDLERSKHQGIVRDIYNEYFSSLARMSFSSPIQKYYIDLFNRFYDHSYYSERYLWGYGRLLRWYFNYDSSDKENFSQQNRHLLEGLISPHKKVHLQNAFLSLIYLLTFRDADYHFCGQNTKDILLSQKVINRYINNEEIKLNQVSEKQHLPLIYQDFINGTASQHIVKNLLQVE
ncbi:MAG: hypothetical protein HC921_16575 [Synechococcaceae cyanobacterium SM2_3_1]|nr:hypothetical protein [Synechococcaceae cyanobacterium SM2_3_1]